MALDLAFTLVVTFAIFFLGSVVYFNDRKNASNILFFFVSFVTVFWALANFFSLNPSESNILTLIRLVLFFAAPHAVLFLLFVYNFPHPNLVIKKSYFVLAITLTIGAMLMAISPYVFVGVDIVNDSPIPQPGPLIPAYAAIVIGSIILGLYFVVRKYRNADDLSKKKWRAIFLGFSVSYFLLAFTQFLSVVIFKNTSLVLFAPLLMLPVFVSVAYATLKYRLLSAKALIVEVLVFSLILLTLFELLLSSTTFQIIFRSIIFTLLFVIGTFLIRAVLREVELREELQIANEGQASLIHFINHQIKGYLSKSRTIFSELMSDQEYGPIPEPAKPLIDEGYKSLTEGVSFVQQILKASDIEKGTMKYEMSPLDFKQIVESTTGEMRQLVEAKGLEYKVEIGDGDYQINGDAGQLKEAVKNFIDNSVKYTPSGSIEATLSKNGQKILFSVRDTGVGLSAEDKARLFTKGGRGKDSQKINVDSTGYGLSIVKGIIEAHKGRVWAESEGKGKGSVFYMELSAN